MGAQKQLDLVCGAYVNRISALGRIGAAMILLGCFAEPGHAVRERGNGSLDEPLTSSITPAAGGPGLTGPTPDPAALDTGGPHP